MTGEIEYIAKRHLKAVLGINAAGIAGLQGVNKCPNLVALYGDSLVAQTFMDPGVRLRRAAFNSINIANALSGQRMVYVMKRAVSGWRSDEVLQRFLSDVEDGSLDASNAGTIIFTMGTNDVAQGSYTDMVSGVAVTPANVADNVVANAARLIDTCTARGIQCIFRTLHGSSNANAAQIALFEDTNRKIGMLPYGRRMWLLETREPLRDPLNTTNALYAFRAGHMMNDSGVLVHEAVPGAVAVGKRLAEIVRKAIPDLPSFYADGAVRYSSNLSSQLLTYPDFSGTTGTLGAGGTLGFNPSGGALAGVPTSWAAIRRSSDSTTTFTINVGEDMAGRYVEFVINTTNAGGIFFQYEVTSAASKVLAGDNLRGFSTVEIMPGAVNLGAAAPAMEVNTVKTGVTSSLFTHGCHQTGSYGAYPSSEHLVLEDATEVATVPAYDSINWLVCRALDVKFTGAGSATVRVRRPRFEKVAAVPAIAA